MPRGRPRREDRGQPARSQQSRHDLREGPGRRQSGLRPGPHPLPPAPRRQARRGQVEENPDEGGPGPDRLRRDDRRTQGGRAQEHLRIGQARGVHVPLRPQPHQARPDPLCEHGLRLRHHGQPHLHLRDGQVARQRTDDGQALRRQRRAALQVRTDLRGERSGGAHGPFVLCSAAHRGQDGRCEDRHFRRAAVQHRGQERRMDSRRSRRGPGRDPRHDEPDPQRAARGQAPVRRELHQEVDQRDGRGAASALRALHPRVGGEGIRRLGRDHPPDRPGVWGEQAGDDRDLPRLRRPLQRDPGRVGGQDPGRRRRKLQRQGRDEPEDQRQEQGCIQGQGRKRAEEAHAEEEDAQAFRRRQSALAHAPLVPVDLRNDRRRVARAPQTVHDLHLERGVHHRRLRAQPGNPEQRGVPAVRRRR